MSISASRRPWGSRLIRSLFGPSDSVPHPLSSSPLPMTQLNEDIIRRIVHYLSPETLGDRVNTANYVFFDAWMKSRYEILTFEKNDNSTKRILDHIVEPNVAKYVKGVIICPWLENPPAVTHTGIGQSFWDIVDPDHIEKEIERRLQKYLQKDIAVVVSAFNAMPNIKEYVIKWDEGKYHPELYKAFFVPILQKWTGQLTKLSIAVPPQFVKSLASVRLRRLETLEYHFCTGRMLPEDIDDIHNGFLVFVNNLKDSLESISFISTTTSFCLDITRIYRSLGPFPKLRSILLSAPFDGAHLSNPLIFVQFLEKHRSTLKEISVLTSRCIAFHSAPSHPETQNWIQRILTSIHTPFPELRSLALAMRPLRAPLTIVSNFMDMHMSTLRSITLVDRALDYRELAPLMETANGPFDLTRLRHFRVKLYIFSPDTLYYLASRMPELRSLDIECSTIKGHRTDPTKGTDFDTFSQEILENKDFLINWKLQRMAIGPKTHDWAHYIESVLVECIPNLRIASSWDTSSGFLL